MYSKDVAPDRRTFRTVFRDSFSSRAISLTVLPFTKCSRLIRPIVSTTNIPRHPLGIKAGQPAIVKRGQSWTPITPLQGQSSTPDYKPAPPKAQRAKQEIDYGRRGKGYVFGAFRPAMGEAFTAPYAGRTTANWVDFLGQVEGWIDAGVERVYAMVDNLNVHSATDVLLFALAHPRWEFVFQPKYAAYLNLIEPWWKVLRSLALKGRRFETWSETKKPSGAPPRTGTRTSILSSGAAGGGTPPRRSGVAVVPNAATLSGCTTKTC